MSDFAALVGSSFDHPSQAEAAECGEDDDNGAEHGDREEDDEDISDIM